MPSKNTKKKLKTSAKSTQHKVEEEVVQTENVETAEVTEIAEVKQQEVASEKVEKNDSKQKNNKKKVKKPSKIKTKTKEVFSELKKVTWPTFPQIVKKTATVFVVVAVFTVVLLGIDKLLQVVYDLFIGNLK